MEKFVNLLNKIKIICKQFWIVFLYIILVIGLQLTLFKDLSSTNTLLANISYIFMDLVVLVIFIFIFRKYFIPDCYAFKNNWKKLIKENYKYWLYGLVVMVISNTIISNFIDIAANEELNRNILAELPVYSILTMVIFSPIIEELMTRIYFKEAFKNKYVYIILSGLIFGSLHLLSITTLVEALYIIPYGALGCAFAYMYSKTNNICTNIFFHSLHNLLAICLIFGGI